MGNDNKMKKKQQKTNSENAQSIEKLHQTFLPQEIPNPEGGVQIYAIEEEYPRSRKNKSYGLYALMTIFLVFLVGSAWVLTQYVQEKNKNTQVDISDFEDINLSQLLDQSKKDQVELKSAQDDLEKLKEEMRIKMRISSGPQRDRLSAYYRKKIREKETEISQLQSKVDSHNKRLKDVEKKAESLVANYQRLYSIKLARKTKEFQDKERALIARYNPTFTNSSVKNAVETGLTQTVEDVELYAYQQLLAKEGIATKQKFETLYQNIAQQRVVLERIEKIPYIRSMPDAIKSLHNQSKSIVATYNDVWYKMYLNIVRKNAQLNQYQYALQRLLLSRSESGIVLDPRNKNKIYVFMSNRYAIKPGDTGYVFRQDDVMIGKISFFRQGNTLYAKTVSIEGTQALQPFDKILLQLKGQ